MVIVVFSNLSSEIADKMELSSVLTAVSIEFHSSVRQDISINRFPHLLFLCKEGYLDM